MQNKIETAKMWMQFIKSHFFLNYECFHNAVAKCTEKKL